MALRENKANAMASSAVFLLCLYSSFALSFSFHQGVGDEDRVIAMATLGGVRDAENRQNSVEIEEIGRFAVDEHNKNEVGPFFSESRR